MRPIRRLRAAPQRGLTLIELMVAMVLGMFLVAVGTHLYLQTASGTRFGAIESRMNEEGALALELLRSQLAIAGYSERNAAGKRVYVGLPVWGCQRGLADTDAAFGAGACKAGGPRNDAIVVGHQATLLNSQSIKQNAPPDLPGNCSNNTIVAVAGSHTADNRFFIAQDANGEPSLYCRGGTGVGFSDRAALVPNVETLHLRYAITRATQPGERAPHQVTAVVDASDLADAAAWTRVAAVDICLIVRSARPVSANGLSMAELTRHVDCEGNVQSAQDGRLRRAYRALVPLPNVRPARPKPFDSANIPAQNPYAHLSN